MEDSTTLSEENLLRNQVDFLRKELAVQDERHRAAITAAENLLTFLRRLYGFDL